MPRQLPARPRLHVSFWFEDGQLQGEMVLMGEDRKGVHRQRYAMNPGDTMTKVHTVLLTIAGQSAYNAGVVDKPAAPAADAPSSAPSSSSSKEPAAEQPAPSKLAPITREAAVTRELPPSTEAKTKA